MEPALGVIISLALVVAAFGGRTQRVVAPVVGSDEVRTSSVTSRGNVFSLGVQHSGTEIKIDSLILEESANLVVARAEGGKAIALSTIKLPKGSYSKLIVSLDKPTKTGDSLLLSLVSRRTAQGLLDGRGEAMTRTVVIE